MNTYIRKIRKNSKALSPVVASIILIAVTVAVSVVVAAWMGGMTIGLMGNAEQVSITNYVCPDTGSVTLTVRNTGGATVTLSATAATMDGKAATLTPVVAPIAPATGMDVSKGGSADFTLAFIDPIMQPGAQYNIKLVTAKGTTIPYTITYNP